MRNVQAAFREVFVRPVYVALAGVVCILAFAAAIWLPNIALLAAVFADAQATLGAKLGIAVTLLAGVATNFNALSVAYTVSIAVLLGIDMALIVYVLRHKSAVAAGKNVVLGSGGVASGLVGVGCAACGSLVLGGLVPSLGVAGALAALPLQGEEFGILGVALLLVSLILVSRNIAEAPACAIERPSSS